MGLVRFALIGWAALHYGRNIIRMTETPTFLWFMGGFIALCLIGSAVEIWRWVRAGK